MSSENDDEVALETGTLGTRWSLHSNYSLQQRLRRHQKRAKLEHYINDSRDDFDPDTIRDHEVDVSCNEATEHEEMVGGEDDASFGDKPSVSQRVVGFQADNDQDFYDNRQDDVLLATIASGKTVGGVVYLFRTKELLLLSDIYCDHLNLITFTIERFKDQVQPTIILTNAKSHPYVSDVINRNEQDIEIQVLGNHIFSYEAAKKNISNLSISALDQHVKIERQLYGTSSSKHCIEENPVYSQLNSIVPLGENRVMVSCAGAILQHLSRSRISAELLNQNGTGLSVKAVRHVNLNGYMDVSMNCILSLQIFCNERHPSTNGGQSKEGLSLFGILNHTKTPGGRSLLRSWFQRPLMDTTLIEQRLDAVSFFTNPRNSPTTTKISMNLKNISNVEVILDGMPIATSLSRWKGLQRFTAQALKVRESISEVGFSSLPIFKQVERVFHSQSLQDISQLINDVIDFDISNQMNRVCVKPNVDDDLDRLKETYHGLGDLLCKVAEEVAKQLPPQLATSINVIYFPQLGYLTTIPIDSHTDPAHLLEDEGFVFQFRTKSVAYYKNSQMTELDEVIGDIHSTIVDTEIRIIQQLTDAVLKNEVMLREISNILSELDCFMSFAEAAIKFKYCRPVMTDRRGHNIQDGRHPLQELIVDDFIGNDAVFGDEHNSVILITGPNSSGKSIYLKQVALIIYMAHIGSFVPATSATIGLTDKILTRIQTRESVAQREFGGNSAFTIDLQQTASAVLNATSRSLVLLDEFGKGTNSHDGVGLFTAVLEFFACQRESPIVIAATHFHEMVDILHSQKLPISHFTMDLMMNAFDDDTSDEINHAKTVDHVTFFYKLKPGRAVSSLGLLCSRLAGVDDKIVDRAKQISDCIAQGISIPIIIDESTKEQAKLTLEWCDRFSKMNLENQDQFDEFLKSLDHLAELLGFCH